MAGTTTNIIPETAFLAARCGRSRQHPRGGQRPDPPGREGVAAAHGAAVEVEIEPGYPVTVNDDAFTALVLSVAREVVGVEETRLLPAPIMGAEDFSYVLEQVPGAMAFVGARPPEVDPATAPMNHSNRVIFDEPAMAVGVAPYVAVALGHVAGG